MVDELSDPAYNYVNRLFFVCIFYYKVTMFIFVLFLALAFSVHGSFAAADKKMPIPSVGILAELGRGDGDSFDKTAKGICLGFTTPLPEVRCTYFAFVEGLSDEPAYEMLSIFKRKFKQGKLLDPIYRLSYNDDVWQDAAVRLKESYRKTVTDENNSRDGLARRSERISTVCLVRIALGKVPWISNPGKITAFLISKEESEDILHTDEIKAKRLKADSSVESCITDDLTLRITFIPRENT